MPNNVIIDKETMQFNASVDKLLQLLAKHLYPHAEIFLRELISNASDALEKVRFAGVSGSVDGVTLNKAIVEQIAVNELKININFDKSKGILSVIDNGIGMTREELIENLGTLAKSGTQQFLEKIEKDRGGNLIGQFGIGFYSVFMVADRVSVKSIKLGSSDFWCWESSGDGSFDISKYDAGDIELSHGTLIELHIKSDMTEEYLDRFRLENIIRQYSNHIQFPIMLPSGNDSGDIERVNEATAIWTKDRAKVTPEEHSDFFKSVAHVGGSPWLVIHNKNEGRDVSFINLLYVPSIKPFDLFNPERRCSVQLYVRGVFITDDSDKVDLLPRYLRFIKGVIDSDDLPLNINRDSLQQTSKINFIRNSLVKKILGELRKIATKDEDKYKEFWNNFGSVMKEGLCEAMDTERREQLMDSCRFTSSTHKFTTIESYIERMAPEQKHIYYLLGDNVDTMMRSPQIEGFIKQGTEVLLLADSVDDFWTHVIFDYKGKSFKSATDADVSPEDNMKEGEKEEDKKNADTMGEDESVDFDKFADYVKDVVGPTVGKVIPSKKLTSSPACLVVSEGSFNMRMERFLIDQKQLGEKRPKVLELNKNHALIEKMIQNYKDNGDNSNLRDYISLLFDSVCIAEGEPVNDALSYSKRSMDLLNKVLS